MNLISRNWTCKNPRCGKGFHSYNQANPPCPACGCVKVSWVPGGGHIGTTGRIDATAKALAANAGMTDINTASPSRLNRAMPRVAQPPVEEGPAVNFAPGFSAPVSRIGATCSPSTSLVKATGNVRIGDAATPMPRSQSFPTTQSATRVVARHNGTVRA